MMTYSRRMNRALTLLVMLATFMAAVLFVDVTNQWNSYFRRPTSRSPNSYGCAWNITPLTQNSEEDLLKCFEAEKALHMEVMSKKVGIRPYDKINISLIAAFEFYTQIVVTITSTGKYGDTIYCRYFNGNGEELGYSYQSAVFPEYTVYCKRRLGVKFMSLSDTPNGNYDYPVPLVNRTLKEPVHFLSVCVSALYGKEPKWLMLAELIEHYKLQGATHFYVYIQEIDEYSRILVDDYIRSGEVEQIVLHDHSNRKDWKWHILGVLECLVRARGHSQWILFGDLDERLITTEYPGTISDFLRNVHDPKIAALQFRQRWILRNESMPAQYVNKSQIFDWMPTRRYHNTSHVGPPGHTERSIIDPKKALPRRARLELGKEIFEESRGNGKFFDDGLSREIYGSVDGQCTKKGTLCVRQ